MATTTLSASRWQRYEQITAGRGPIRRLQTPFMMATTPATHDAFCRRSWKDKRTTSERRRAASTLPTTTGRHDPQKRETPGIFGSSRTQKPPWSDCSNQDGFPRVSTRRDDEFQSLIRAFRPSDFSLGLTLCKVLSVSIPHSGVSAF